MPKKRKRIEKKINIDGKRISVYGYSAYEIQEKIEKLQQESDNKKYPFFNDILDDWEEAHFSEIAIGTQTCYKPAIKRARDEFKDVRLSEIKSSEITALLNELAAKGYSYQTVKVQRVVISLIFQFAQSKDLINSNPAEFAEMPKKLPSSKREIPEDNILDIILKSSDKSFGEFPLFLLLTGCRRGEALAVQWENVDFFNKTISISKTIVYNGNQPIIEDHTKTSAGMRKIVIPDILISILKKNSANANLTDFVFGDKGQPFTQSQFRRRWEKYLNETKIKVTPHQLRHAYATMLFDANIDEKIAQSLLGHSKIDITKNIYTHIRQERKTQAQQTLNDFITKKISKLG